MSRKNQEKKKKSSLSERNSFEGAQGRRENQEGDGSQIMELVEEPELEKKDSLKQIYLEPPQKERSGRVSFVAHPAWQEEAQGGKTTIIRSRGIPAKALTSQGIAVCLFPEQPQATKFVDYVDDPQTIRPEHVSPVEAVRFAPTKTKKKLNYHVDRERWRSRLVYLLAFSTLSLSFNNIYHFPFLLIHNGGGGFLFIYTITTLLLGYPLHFLQTTFGQYAQRGVINVWSCAPIALGIGCGMLLLCILMCLYYNMYATYSLIYLSRCFNRILPWNDCKEISLNNCVPRICNPKENNQILPTESYFYNHILEAQPQTPLLSHAPGSIKSYLVLGLFYAWFVVYVTTLQGVRSIGKVVFFLLILPYFCLLMLLGAAIQLEGSSSGISKMFGGGMTVLGNFEIWTIAVQQVLMELGIGQGIPLVYGSFCRHRNRPCFDSAFVVIFNYCNSLLCGMVVYLILGAIAAEVGVEIDELLKKSYGSVYYIYSDGILRIPCNSLWCFLFFLMLFSVVISTHMGIFLVISTVIIDIFPNSLPYRWLFNLCLCLIFFICGLVFCTDTGFFAVHFLHYMPAAMAALLLTFFFIIGIVLIYGMKNYVKDMKFLKGYHPSFVTRIWLYVIPVLLLIFLIGGWIAWTPMTLGGYFYANYIYSTGWSIIVLILLTIFFFAIFWVIYEISLNNIKNVLRPSKDWGPLRYKETRGSPYQP